jgi:EpsI family protein
MREWRLVGPAIVLASGVLLTSGVRTQSTMALASPLRAMPPEMGGISGIDQPISADEQRVAGMSDYLYRVFPLDSVSRFTVYVGYYPSQTSGRTIHSPRNCLPGAGWQTLTNTPTLLAVGGRAAQVNRVLIANGNSQAVVYYWYQGRGRVAWNEYRVKWDLLRDAALYGRSEEALVRVLVPVTVKRAAPGDSSASTWGPAQLRADSLTRALALELIPRVDALLPPWKHGDREQRAMLPGRALDPTRGGQPACSGSCTPTSAPESMTSAAAGPRAASRARWRAALARLPQVDMSHQRRRPFFVPS